MRDVGLWNRLDDIAFVYDVKQLGGLSTLLLRLMSVIRLFHTLLSRQLRVMFALFNDFLVIPSPAVAGFQHTLVVQHGIAAVIGCAKWCMLCTVL